MCVDLRTHTLCTEVRTGIMSKEYGNARRHGHAHVCVHACECAHKLASAHGRVCGHAHVGARAHKCVRASICVASRCAALRCAALRACAAQNLRRAGHEIQRHRVDVGGVVVFQEVDIEGVLGDTMDILGLSSMA